MAQRFGNKDIMLARETISRNPCHTACMPRLIWDALRDLVKVGAVTYGDERLSGSMPPEPGAAISAAIGPGVVNRGRGMGRPAWRIGPSLSQAQHPVGAKRIEKSPIMADNQHSAVIGFQRRLEGRDAVEV